MLRFTGWTGSIPPAPSVFLPPFYNSYPTQPSPHTQLTPLSNPRFQRQIRDNLENQRVEVLWAEEAVAALWAVSAAAKAEFPEHTPLVGGVTWGGVSGSMALCFVGLDIISPFYFGASTFTLGFGASTFGVSAAFGRSRRSTLQRYPYPPPSNPTPQSRPP